jgi:hypothetical protein
VQHCAPPLVNWHVPNAHPAVAAVGVGVAAGPHGGMGTAVILTQA